jgi:sarcosine oxidase subunit alpha
MDRLKELPTLRIRTEKKVSLKYRGSVVQGVGGDTVATALFAHGVRIFGRSLKYHRPRGLYSLDGECSNTMMQIDGVPNVRAENTPAKDGMSVQAQNALWSPEFDLLGFMDKLSWAMPAGFYYKVFHKPARIWPFAIKRIRKAAGLGVIGPDFEMAGKYDEIYPRADICVLGGGPAGLNAALAAAESGLSVILFESRPWLGGFFDYRSLNTGGVTPPYERASVLAGKIENNPNIRVFRNASVVGTYSDNLVTAFQRGGENDNFDERYIEVRSKSIVVATGCIERPLLFENNEKPGVMQVGCAHRLARTWGILPGRQAVFSIGHDLGIEAAIDLADLGLKVHCVADIREDGQDPLLVQELEERGIPFYRGWVATEAKGWNRLKHVKLGSVGGSRKREFDCDTLVASAGLTPVWGPLSLGQAKMSYDLHTGFFLPKDLPKNMYVAGRMIGFADPASIEASGRLAGLSAAGDCGVDAVGKIATAKEELESLPATARGSKFTMAPVKGKKAFICFDEDTTVKNIDQAIAMGFDMPELIKRFTSAGTGPGQGGIPGHNLPLYVASTMECPSVVKPTSMRAPLVPVLIATYAGSNHDMSKKTALHESQKAAGAVMERVGVWVRARRFSEDKSARTEVENVRNNVGILDASTLGKFRIHGPDALKALQRIYVSDISKVVKGRMRYSAMCNEDGCVIDDGVITKLGENDYYFTTSTARAGQTAEWIRYHTRYDGWNYHIVNLTDAYGVINLAGPNSRKVLEKVAEADVSDEAFPFSCYREFNIQGIPVRAMRLGFVGELSYEFHVPASYTQALWDVLIEAGKEFGMKNFGLEAQNTLRLEKGHIILGSESEQRTTLHDIGLGFLWNRNKSEWKTVGAVALKQTEHQEGRLKLVGFKTEHSTSKAPRDGSPIVDGRVRGYVCTARFSSALQEPVGMALVDDDLAKEGSRLAIFEDDCDGQLIHAKVVPMPFYDPEGSRMKM